MFAVAKIVAGYDSGPLTAIVRGAQAAYAAIINRWQSHRGPTNWIHFDNVGHWGTSYLDRAPHDRAPIGHAKAFLLAFLPASE